MSRKPTTTKRKTTKRPTKKSTRPKDFVGRVMKVPPTITK